MNSNPFALVLFLGFLIVGNGVVWFDEKSYKQAVRFQQDLEEGKPEAIDRYRALRARYPDYQIQTIKTEVKISLGMVNLAAFAAFWFFLSLFQSYRP